MKHRFATICLVAAGLFAVQANAQSLTTADGSTSGGPYNENPGPISFNPDALTQSVSDVPEDGNTVACGSAAGTTENHWLRLFDTTDLPLGFVVKSVDMAIQQADDPVTNSQDLVVDIYSLDPLDAFTFANMVLQGTSGPIPIADQTCCSNINVPVGATVPAGDHLIVDMWIGDGQPNGAFFRVAGNSSGQTAPSYLAAAACGLADPFDMADIGFPNVHLIMTVNGVLVPVELISFDAVVSGTDVSLNWATVSETNNAGFEVQMLNGESWNALGFVEGHGTTTEAQTYSYTAEDMGVGTHMFRLKQIDFDGAFEYSDELEVTVETPGTHLITSAYPNPFNPQSQFTLSVAQDQVVTAELFNTLGQRVAVLFNGTVEANQAQLVTIDGAGLASGMYIVRINGERFSDALSVTLLK